MARWLKKLTLSSLTEDLTSKVGKLLLQTALTAGKLEDSVLEIEKRRITKDEGRKAQSAMEALNVGNATAKPKAEDVDYIVGSAIP